MVVVVGWPPSLNFGRSRALREPSKAASDRLPPKQMSLNFHALGNPRQKGSMGVDYHNEQVKLHFSMELKVFFHGIVAKIVKCGFSAFLKDSNSSTIGTQGKARWHFSVDWSAPRL